MNYSPILFFKIADLNLTQYHNCYIDMDCLNSKENIIQVMLRIVNYHLIHPMVEIL